MKILPNERIALKDEPISGTVIEVEEHYLIVIWDDAQTESIVPILAVRKVS